MLRNAKVTFEEKPQLKIISFGILNTDIYTYLIRQICPLMVLIKSEIAILHGGSLEITGLQYL